MCDYFPFAFSHSLSPSFPSFSHSRPLSPSIPSFSHSRPPLSFNHFLPDSRPPLSFNHFLPDSLLSSFTSSSLYQHTLPTLNVPNHTEDSVYPLPHAVFRIYDNSDIQFSPPVRHTHMYLLLGNRLVLGCFVSE